MPEMTPGTRECPFCKEEIKADAIKCKHCGSAVAPERPSHGGTCPYCKEAINPDAVKCKHCGSMVGGPGQAGCAGCGQGVNVLPRGPGVADSGMAPGALSHPMPGAMAAAEASCSECFDVIIGGPFGRIARASVRICCKPMWIPFLGVVTVCWAESCYGAPGGVIIA